MCEVTRMNASRHTDEWIMSYIWRSLLTQKWTLKHQCLRCVVTHTHTHTLAVQNIQCTAQHMHYIAPGNICAALTQSQLQTTHCSLSTVQHIHCTTQHMSCTAPSNIYTALTIVITINYVLLTKLSTTYCSLSTMQHTHCTSQPCWVQCICHTYHMTYVLHSLVKNCQLLIIH